ncbi:cilia- and flagella-associated protein 300 isoform X1 [Apis mellifera]|uniref:Cilia- and flagella-associated protein 300 n=1 Tax=Apis mellifera TaxID=7460 RepID=A0A7M7FZ81_APIME|nr:cilia- and flagella-associated protein 300 isoform X1 [Apis mellifera]|eukprot:XP_001122247.5 cilia- and flagella-associated protein 300 isoform X1 [Apis mellifera]
MEIEHKYTFVPLVQKNLININDKKIQEFLTKWGIKGNFIIQHFTFNEPFQKYHKYHLAEAFFKDSTVAKELLTKQGNYWAKQDIIASSVEINPISCSVLNMSFFNKLKDPKNGIVHKSGAICKRFDMEIENFLISDNLRAMLLDEECPEYNLYLKDEREEFIFFIFQMLVLGGILCQYEDILNPYLEVTKAMYKDLIKVQKNEDTDLSISTIVLQVIAKDSKGEAYFPYDPSHMQNIGFLLIDSVTHEITTFLHQFGEYCLSQ